MMRIPGPREAIFRISQEAANLRDYLLPLRGITGSSRFAAPFPALPDPEKVAGQLRGTPFAGEIARLAAEIRAHRLPIFGSVWETGPEIDWRCDYPGAVSTGLGYFRRIPYLDPAQVGDHKNVWEINRHQHLVVLAQDHLLHGNRESLDTIGRHLESWWQANLYLQGINWTSALEVAFRALSWLWVYHLAGPALSGALQARLIEGLRRHGRFLAHNLSVYFSPNTHLLGEAVVLHAIGTLLPALPEAAGWRNTGRRIVLEQMPVQVRPDGG